MSDGYVLSDAAGSISVPQPVLAAIVQRAAETVEGVQVRRRRRIEVHVEGGAARVDITLAARYGTVLPELARAVQERVAETLGAMCGLVIEAVDVTVEELVGA